MSRSAARQPKNRLPRQGATKTGGVGSRKAGAVSTPKARIWKGLTPLFQALEDRKGAFGAVLAIRLGGKFHAGAAGIRLQGQDKFLQDGACQVVMQALDRLTQDRTSIVIAHRLATITRADVIFVVKEGKIVETGCHQELQAFGGLYAALCALQFREEILPGYSRRR